MNSKLITFFFFLIFLTSGSSTYSQQETFTNPLLPSGADPYSTYYEGYYYYTHTVGNRLVLYKTDNLARLRDAEHTTIWTPTEGKPWSKHIWAPEFHIIDGKWYVYFAADGGHNDGHRMYVLENTSEDPFLGEWVMKGRVGTHLDRWAIDGNVFTYQDQLYMIWSGWAGNTNGQQNIYIAEMENPWTIRGNRVMISSPTYPWEKQGDLTNDPVTLHLDVNEGPQFLQNGEHVFIVYSASACWSDYYCLGLLTFDGSNMMDPSAWSKSPKPLFKQSLDNKVYAPGHNSFFKSPDGTEDWILYHANTNPGDGCGGKRSPRMQKVSWNADGTPHLGAPVAEGLPLAIPSEK